MQICIFNPDTTLIDVTDSSVLLSQGITTQCIAGATIPEGAMVSISQVAGVQTAILADASLNLSAAGFATTAALSGQAITISLTGIATIPTNSLVAANVGSTMYLNNTGFVSLTEGSPLVQAMGPLLTVGPSSSTMLFSPISPVATPIAQVDLTSPNPGNFTVAHGLGVTPSAVNIEMTSSGQIWFQTPLKYDSTNLYLVASDVGLTGHARIWLG